MFYEALLNTLPLFSSLKGQEAIAAASCGVLLISTSRVSFSVFPLVPDLLITEADSGESVEVCLEVALAVCCHI